MTTNYEILIRFDESGAYKGAHLIQMENGAQLLPRPIQPGDWPAIVSGVNAAAVARVAELEKEIEDAAPEKEALIAAKKELDDLKKPERDKKLEAVRAQKAALEKEEAELLK